MHEAIKSPQLKYLPAGCQFTTDKLINAINVVLYVKKQEFKNEDRELNRTR